MISVERHFTSSGEDPLASVSWEGHDVPAPQFWSETAVQIAKDRYFRRGEKSVSELVKRVVKAVQKAGEWQGYLGGSQSSAFADELSYILIHQLASFNSPVYFNVGLFSEYGVLGQAENFYFDLESQQVRPLSSAYLHPQASACFIQSVRDDLIGIYDLIKSEAKLFKYGSGTGTNFSTLRARGESLETGGVSTGMLSYLEVFDKSAHAIKSGGTLRRAAKMVIVDADHPEILDFINWKKNEERKARVLVAAGYSSGMDGEAFRSVSGQNSNNSVRVTDDFMNKALRGGDWELMDRVKKRVVKTLPAAEIWQAIAAAAWECADPGVQFHDTIQRSHICPAFGPIRASNPCSEFMFVDDSACNLASLNLAKFWREGKFDWTSFRHVARVMLLAQDILVDYASYPTAQIAENSHRLRPLGLGYANLGGLFIRMGIPYDSAQAEDWTLKVTSALQLAALSTSAELAEKQGAFADWSPNREAALRVLDRQARLAREKGVWADEFEACLKRIEKSGLRNAQVTLIAPTGTIGLLMDCDTLGIEPDYSLRKQKFLVGGGQMHLSNQALREGLATLGYTGGQIDPILSFVAQRGHVVGAPGLKPEHLPVFDCAVPPSGHLERCVSPEGHLRIMAAAQPFLSGAISKTVNLGVTATVDDVKSIFKMAWELELKAISIYRDGSKAIQPLCAEC
ncbi:MAG: adenosylcobalamin-dependent ribonucleoside-diphosphate reductase [Bdellovibrionales bacterium]